ncbi:Hypothetical protein D9617_6g094610 [Elsinoe fawcettii]|nr:Hypothetical protein D9617_6g094610 [Elsinoe fawcettii]
MADPTRRLCIPPDQDDDKDGDSKGQCKEGEIMDPAAGKQDPKAATPECIPDDASRCGHGEVPASRSPSDKGPKDSVDCAKDTDEKDKPKCKQGEYSFVEVFQSAEGVKTAKYSCKKTQDFKDRKRDKLNRIFEAAKAGYDKKRAADDEERKKNDERKKQDEDRDAKKRDRLGKCLTIIPLGFAADYATNFFDEDFLESAFVLEQWPVDLADVPESDIDTDEWQSQFIELIQNDPGPNQGHNGNGAGEFTLCGGIARRGDSLIRRVAPHCRRQAPFPANLTSVLIVSPLSPTDSAGSLPGSWRPDDSEIDVHVKFANIAAPIISFVTRLAGIASKFSKVARIEKIMKQGGPKVAPRGQGKPRADMEKAVDQMKKSKNWRNCLEGKAPKWA